MKQFFILALTFALGFPTTGRADELAGSKPNIIVLITDDQGYAPVGRHGHPWIKTPHMDTLFDASTRFDRMLVAPTCSPTRAALMSGRHPMKNGITHTILERERMNPETITLPHILREAGYTTGIFGKWHLGDEDTHQPHNRGFDEAFIHGAGGIGQAYACSCADAPGNKYFNPVIRHNGSFVQTEGYCTDIFYNAGLGWIKDVKDKDEPFFAYITTNAPHGPFIAPPTNEKRFTDLGFSEKTAGFYGMIENIDENIGLMLEKLEEWKLMENTLIIFMSDNGMTGGGSGPEGKALGQDENGSDMFRYNAGMKGLKGSCDEGGVRVPFFMRWDGKIKPNVQIDTIAAHFDIYPTLATIAGAKIPTAQVEGRSLVPLIENPKAAWEDRYLFTHKARWPTGSEPDYFQWLDFGVRNQQYRYVGPSPRKAKKPRKGKAKEGAPEVVAENLIGSLYDMQKDPSQKNDIAAEHPEIIKAMKAAYDKFWEETRPLMVNEDVPMSETKPFHVWFEEQSKSADGIPDWKKREL